VINGTHLHLVTGSGDPGQPIHLGDPLTPAEAPRWVTEIGLPKRYEDGHLGVISRDNPGGDFAITRNPESGGWVATFWCDGTTAGRCNELARNVADTAAAMNGTASPN
jgi:hypothetical protein